MIQTVLTYSILTIAMYLLCKKAEIVDSWRYVIIALGVYSLVFGFRYGVGTDYFAYVEMYKNVISNYPIRDVEIGYLYLMKASAFLNLPIEAFMFITSFIPIYFTFKILKDNLNICKFLVLSFMLTAFWLSYMNGLRQIIAVSLWIYSIKYIIEKEPIKHYILIFLAISFHNSAYVLLIFYPLITYKNEWFQRVSIQIGILMVSLILMRLSFVQNIISNVEYLLTISGYEWYVDHAHSKLIQDEQLVLGVGFYINIARIILLICLSSKVKSWANSDLFIVIYNFFFIGIIIKYGLWGSQLIGRLNWYFFMTESIVGAYTLAYLFENTKKYYSLILFAFWGMTFVATLYKAIDNTSYFVYTWQHELYYIKNNLSINPF